LGGAPSFLPGLASDCNLLTYASHIARITVVKHHAHLVCWDMVMLTFCMGWPWT
jgi:hypothetical protein